MDWWQLKALQTLGSFAGQGFGLARPAAADRLGGLARPPWPAAA
jgi:EAL domain-containing protein (putative c-di-GMP-specific phosphodiesterase class I)